MSRVKLSVQLALASLLAVSIVLFPSGSVLAVKKVIKSKAPPKVLHPAPKKLKARIPVPVKKVLKKSVPSRDPQPPALPE